MSNPFKQRAVVRLLATAFATLVTSGAMAQSGQVFAYPNGGQSQQQQDQDRYQCHQWSVSQTGFDPTAMPPPQAAVPPPPPGGYSDQRPQQQSSGNSILGIGGGLLGDAAKGAALGAAGGALTGDAGKGAAIGALASTALGAFTRANQPAPQQAAPPPQGYDYYEQNQAQAMQDRQRKQNDYNGAFGACMKARNYTVN